MIARATARLGIAIALLVGAGSAVAQTQTLTIYSSLPLQGLSGPQSRSIVDAERLALEQAGGQAGPFRITLKSLDASTNAAGKWEPGRVLANASRASVDPSTIAYVGEFNSAASAISMPILNNAGVLQVSPSNTAIGLTRSEGAERGEPRRYYPTGVRTYGRVVPADHLQADAILRLLQLERVRRLFVADDGEVYGAGLAAALISHARRAGIRVVGHTRFRRRNEQLIAQRVRRSGAQGFFFGGITQNRAADLFDAVARANRSVSLIGDDGVAESSFARDIAAATRARIFITLPTLSPSSYPPAAQEFFAAYRGRYRREPEPYAVYGYETMRLVLDAIGRAGSQGNDRQAVVDAFFATKNRDSVLGRYSIDVNGDTTLSTYQVLRVDRRGRLVYDRVIDSAER